MKIKRDMVQRSLSIALLIFMLAFILACSQKLEESSLYTSESSSGQSASSTSPSEQTPQTGTTPSTKTPTATPSAPSAGTTAPSSLTIELSPSPQGTDLQLQNWCRKIITPNIDPLKGYIKRILGNENKHIIGVDVDTCHYNEVNLNTSIKTDTWESQQGKYPYYKLKEVTINGKLSSNTLVVTKKEGTTKTKCEGLNIPDITKADIVLPCE